MTDPSEERAGILGGEEDRAAIETELRRHERGASPPPRRIDSPDPWAGEPREGAPGTRRPEAPQVSRAPGGARDRLAGPLEGHLGEQEETVPEAPRAPRIGTRASLT